MTAAAVSRYAAEYGIAEDEALKKGMEAKSKEFVEKQWLTLLHPIPQRLTSMADDDDVGVYSGRTVAGSRVASVSTEDFA